MESQLSDDANFLFTVLTQNPGTNHLVATKIDVSGDNRNPSSSTVRKQNIGVTEQTDILADIFYFHIIDHNFTYITMNKGILSNNGKGISIDKIIKNLEKIYKILLARDNIDEDFLEGIFTPFRKGIKGEFGLGLSIVKKTLNIMGYDIEIVNEKKGVSFIITKGIHK